MISGVSLVTQTMNDITKSIAQILKVRASYPKQGINPFEWTTSLNSFHKQSLLEISFLPSAKSLPSAS